MTAQEEIELIRPLSDGRRQRVILFTDRELEPYHPYDRTKLEFDIDDIASDFEDLARISDLVQISSESHQPRLTPNRWRATPNVRTRKSDANDAILRKPPHPMHQLWRKKHRPRGVCILPRGRLVQRRLRRVRL